MHVSARRTGYSSGGRALVERNFKCCMLYGMRADALGTMLYCNNIRLRLFPGFKSWHTFFSLEWRLYLDNRPQRPPNITKSFDYNCFMTCERRGTSESVATLSTSSSAISFVSSGFAAASSLARFSVARYVPLFFFASWTIAFCN